jgi:hypothetical protein
MNHAAVRDCEESWFPETQAGRLDIEKLLRFPETPQKLGAFTIEVDHRPEPYIDQAPIRPTSGQPRSVIAAR